MRAAFGVFMAGLFLSGVAASAFPADGCADLAHTEIFRSKGLEYVLSREFADAIRAVAIGASKYSPREIPASWKDDAEACNPSLVYLASMEYRSKPGHEEVTPVFPRTVEAAIREAHIVAEWNKAGPFAERAAAVEFKIAVAERMGAGECARTELMSAKLLLELSRNLVAASRSNTEGVEWLNRAEQNAESLLANRRFAFRQGVLCTETPD